MQASNAATLPAKQEEYRRHVFDLVRAQNEKGYRRADMRRPQRQDVDPLIVVDELRAGGFIVQFKQSVGYWEIRW